MCCEVYTNDRLSQTAGTVDMPKLARSMPALPLVG